MGFMTTLSEYWPLDGNLLNMQQCKGQKWQQSQSTTPFGLV
uniref:Uncharacterized protein n=1 Tax=Rhizophora mucronata TaxID=61149 RepID=A0A2P2R593_RHIMU